MVKLIFAIALLIFVLTGCAAPIGYTSEPAPAPLKITHEQAQEIMRDYDVIILDVRTPDEFRSGHIENAVLLPLDELQDRALDVIGDTDTIVLIYCRSGRRSADAAWLLNSLGFVNVYDFGGILDWPGNIVIPDGEP